jgi:hypothetical protein
VAIEIQDELAAYTHELAAVVTGGSLRAIVGDFYETEPPGTFNVVAYFDGFGIGSDEDQRRLLRRIVGWLFPGGCALVDVLVPWYWAGRAGNEEEFPVGSGVRYLDGFDPEGCRMTERMWRVGHEDDVVTQSLRCYSPADLYLLLEGTGLSVVDVEPFTDEGYSEPCELADAMLYLATLAPANPRDPVRRTVALGGVKGGCAWPLLPRHAMGLDLARHGSAPMKASRVP